MVGAEDAQPIRAVPGDYNHYRALDPDQNEIRILVLHPSTDPTRPVICSLVRTVVAPGALNYETLSYCWGDLKNTKDIIVRHLETSTFLHGKKIYHIGREISFPELADLPASVGIPCTSAMHLVRTTHPHHCLSTDAHQMHFLIRLSATGVMVYKVVANSAFLRL
jgi:hypothetical protein